MARLAFGKDSFLRAKWRKFRQKRQKIKIKWRYYWIARKTQARIKQLKQKDKIKVAFLQMYIGGSQNHILFKKLFDDENFEPYFIINPDVSRSDENFRTQYELAYNELALKYGKERVLHGYNFVSQTFYDYTDKFDLMTTANPYDSMAHQFFKIKYWVKRSVPVFYISYFYMGRCLVTIDNLKLEVLNYVWKFFVENTGVIELAQIHQVIKGKNMMLSGYPKMDFLAHIPPRPKRERKLIIIAPHHSIYEAQLAIGSFLQNYDILWQCMQKYKDIDFVFRPHPLLFQQLVREDFWGEQKTKEYFDKVCSLSNVTYSTQGDYMEIFAYSDGLIHDCGSFMAEYLYTGKPCAFLYRDNLNPQEVWTDFGRKCAGVHYSIYNADDIDRFIQSVIILGNDSKKVQRTTFAKNEVMINYPYATQTIYEFLKQTFEIGGR